MTFTRVRVASYNIRKAIGTDRRRNPERILAVLAEIDADIVALQEADRRFGPRVSAIPHQMLHHMSDYGFAPVAHHADGLGWHGNALLVRRNSEIGRHETLHLPCLEPRGAVLAEVVLPGARGPVRVLGMHLDLSGLWRRRQAAAVLHAAQSGNDMPVVMMGDLNEWSAGRGCIGDFSRHFAFAPTGRSFHARRPVARLDRIMFSPALTLIACGVHDSATARTASDHLPVWAEFELN